MHRSLLAATLSAALLLPASAGASTVSSTPLFGSFYSTTFQGGAGPADVTLTASNGWADAAQALTAGANCTAGAGTVSCPAASDVTVNLRNANDRFTNTFYYYGLTVHGGGGNDTLTGNGNQTSLSGDGGADTIDVAANATSYGHGGTGADDVRGGFPKGNGTSLDGGDGPDLVVGNSNNDSVAGNDGQDQLFSVRGVQSTLDGGISADTLVSLATINPAFLGTVTMIGGDGPDTIAGNKTRDVVDAGKGNDVIDVSDAERVDEVTCGTGTDTVYADATDVIAPDCENVVYGPAPDLPKVDAAKAHLAEAFPNTPQAYTP